MIKRLASVGLTIYVLLVFASSAKAEPLSCTGYAITNSERQSVEILQDMNAVKSEMVTIEQPERRSLAHEAPKQLLDVQHPMGHRLHLPSKRQS